MVSIASQKRRIQEILDSDRFETIKEKEVTNRRGTIYLPESAGKTVFVVIVDSSSEREIAKRKEAHR